jgi:hypothetical protein
MPAYKLPLSVDEQQRISDAANPFDVPALLDLVARSQEIIGACRCQARIALKDRDETRHCLRNIVAMCDQIMPESQS